MVVCKMRKTIGGTFKRDGEKSRVAGFRPSDTYSTAVLKAACTMNYEHDAIQEKGTLVIGRVRVVNSLLQNGKPWTLGGYLEELGGSKRIILGVYVPNEIVSPYMCVVTMHFWLISNPTV